MSGGAVARAYWARLSSDEAVEHARRAPAGAGALVNTPPLTLDVSLPGRRSRAVTRAFDLAVAITALVALLPLFLVIATAVRLSSPGPVLFRQRRLGRSGRPFNCLKFRTMGIGAESALLRLLRDNPNLSAEFEGSFKLRNDPRVTQLGRFLRATSLDELPQIFNVLRNDMSIVGPRPIVEAERSRYGERLSLVLGVKPGMTGLWQVSGRNDLTYDERVQIDTDYVLQRRLRKDLLICLRTVGVVFGRVGAY